MPSLAIGAPKPSVATSHNTFLIEVKLVIATVKILATKATSQHLLNRGQTIE